MNRLLAVLVRVTPTQGETQGQERISSMSVKKAVLAGLLVPLLLAGCLLVPGPRGRGAVLVPPLPPLVVLETEPYYVHGGYHYHYRNDGWYYSNSRTGTWAPLPRDHYPKEVKFKGRGAEKGHGPNPGHQGR